MRSRVKTQIINEKDYLRMIAEKSLVPVPVNSKVKLDAELSLSENDFLSYAQSKDSEVFSIKQGDPMIILQEKKTAVFEIDYSKLIITDSKDHDNDMNFALWMAAQDEDNDKWLKDWEEKDSAECHKAFRDHFNDEIKKGIKLTKLGKDYKVTLRLLMLDFGPAAKMKLTGFSGGEAKADGELEICDKNTGETLLLLEFTNLKGESSFKQIGRLKGIFENLGEELSEYLEDYQKEYEKQLKKQKKQDKKKK